MKKMMKMMMAAAACGLGALAGCVSVPPQTHLTPAQQKAADEQQQALNNKVWTSLYADNNKVWTYWGIAPDGVTVLQSDDFSLVRSADGRYWGELTDAYGHFVAGGSYGALQDDHYIWRIINGHFYYPIPK
jgi:outer membrane murein-binding lipoprotein Lpp